MVRRRQGKNRRVTTRVKGQSTLDNFSGEVTIKNHTVRKRKKLTFDEKMALMPIVKEQLGDKNFDFRVSLLENKVEDEFFEEFATDPTQSAQVLADKIYHEKSQERLESLKKKYTKDYLRMPLTKERFNEIADEFGPSTYGNMMLFHHRGAKSMLSKVENGLDELFADMLNNRYNKNELDAIRHLELFLDYLDEHIRVLEKMQDGTMWMREINGKIIDLRSYRSDYEEVLINDTRSHTQWGDQERSLITNQVNAYANNVHLSKVFQWDTQGIFNLKDEWYDYYKNLSKYVLDMTYVIGDYYSKYVYGDEESKEKFINKYGTDDPEYFKSIEEYSASLNEMINMLPGVENDMIFYRGGRFDENAEVGDVGEFKYITSASFDRHVALEFAHEQGRNEYLITIYAPKGSHIASVDKNAVPDAKLTDLHELILGQGQKYQVIGVNHEAQEVDIMLIN